MKGSVLALAFAILSFSGLAETMITIQDVDNGFLNHDVLKLDSNGRVYLKYDGQGWWHDLGAFDTDAFSYVRANLFLLKTGYIESFVDESGRGCEKLAPPAYWQMTVTVGGKERVVLSDTDCTAASFTQPENDYVRSSALGISRALFQHYHQFR